MEAHESLILLTTISEKGHSGVMFIAEVVHWGALAFMMLVYSARLVWLFSHPAGRDRQAKGERAADNGAMLGAMFSLGNVAMPWEMESTRKGFGFYLSFVLFHIGVTAGIFLAFVSSLYRPLHEIPVVGYAFMAAIGIAFLISLARVVRRFAVPHMRLISTPDDHFALWTLSVWFFFGFMAQGHIVGLFASEIWLVGYLFCTTFFLIYVPFSKISHYLYYPFTRWWLGKTLGHRGSLAISRVKS